MFQQRSKLEKCKKGKNNIHCESNQFSQCNISNISKSKILNENKTFQIKGKYLKK